MSQLSFKDKNVLVVGCDYTTLDAAKLLVEQGAHITFTDLKNKSDLKEFFDAWGSLPHKLELGRHVVRSFQNTDLILMSRLASREGKPFQKAALRKVLFITDIEIGAMFIPETKIALYGSFGKSSTSSIFSEMMSLAGKRCLQVNNETAPICAQILAKKQFDCAIFEIPLKNLAYLQNFEPDFSIVLNFMDERPNNSSEIKEISGQLNRIISNCLVKNKPVLINQKQKPYFERLSVVNADQNLNKNIQYFSTSLNPHGRIKEKEENGLDFQFEVNSNTLHYNDVLNTKHLIRLSPDFYRFGIHVENLSAAILLGIALKVEPQIIHKVVSNFKGLEHRMEIVKELNSVTFINNSKSISLESLQNTIKSLPGKVILIAGGKEEELADYIRLGDVVQKKVKSLILVDESKDRMNRCIGDFTTTIVAGSFEEAVFISFQKSRKGDLVIFAPGCQPSSRFKDYAERGRFFKHLVHHIV